MRDETSSRTLPSPVAYDNRPNVVTSQDVERCIAYKQPTVKLKRKILLQKTSTMKF